MKIRIYDSDGIFRGGLLKTELLSGCRKWNGSPHPNYTEIMVDLSGHGEPLSEQSWHLIQFSKHPEISGSPRTSDEFDAASQVIRMTPFDALRWFQNSVYPVPPELAELARTNKGRGGSDEAEAEQTHADQALTPAQQKIWDALDGKAMLAKELAVVCYGDIKHSSAVRKQVEGIRRTGRTIDQKRGIGYLRPDAPPAGSDSQCECARSHSEPLPIASPNA